MKKLDEFVKQGRLKKAAFNEDMYKKEYDIGKKDYDAAIESFESGNHKWATIQAYYAIFHAVRALVYKAGYREESHLALKAALKELYIEPGILPKSVYETLERGMDLREMADYKDSYSKRGAENLISVVKSAIEEVKRIL